MCLKWLLLDFTSWEKDALFSIFAAFSASFMSFFKSLRSISIYCISSCFFFQVDFSLFSLSGDLGLLVYNIE